MYDEYDEEVAAAEAAEEAAIAGRTLEDKDAEIKPFLPKCALVIFPALMHAHHACMPNVLMGTGSPQVGSEELMQDRKGQACIHSSGGSEQHPESMNILVLATIVHCLANTSSRFDMQTCLTGRCQHH